MTQTTNYQLPQWEANDPLRRKDFNGAMESIDALLQAKANRAALEAYQTSNDTAVVVLDSKVNSVSSAAAGALAQAKQELAAKIEAAQAAASAAQTAANAAWAPDNAPYVMGTYFGTGKSGADDPCQIAVGFRPSALLICPAMARQGTGLDGKTVTPPSHLFALYPSASGSLGSTVTWLDDGVSWYSSTAHDQCNASNNTYFYIAFR